MSLNVFGNGVGAAAGDFASLFVGEPSTNPVRARQAGDSTVPTVNMFIDSEDPDYEYGASIIRACADVTVLELQCTASAGRRAQECSSDAAKWTVTVNPSLYGFSSASTTRTMGVDVTATIQENCRVAAPTSVNCAVTIQGEADGHKTSTATSVVYTGTNEVYMFDVQITGGAEKTAQATGNCMSGAGSVSPKKVALVAGLLGGAVLSALMGM